MNYLILSSPRTGSTMLAAALTATGRAGTVKEYFHLAELAGSIRDKAPAGPIAIARPFQACTNTQYRNPNTTPRKMVPVSRPAGTLKTLSVNV